MQEANVRGLSNLHRFEPGSNMQAWLLTILRNQFYTSQRRRRREMEDPDGVGASLLACPPSSTGAWTLRISRKL